MKLELSFFIILISMLSFGQTQETKERKGFAVSVNLKYDEASMTKEEFKNSSFGVHSFYPEFVDRIGLKGFTLKYSRQKPIVVKGNRLSKKAIRRLKRLKMGDQITVYDAISQPDGDYRVEIRGPMIITLK